MNLTLQELDIALKFCESKMDSLTKNNRFMLDKSSPDHESNKKEREFWQEKKINIEGQMEQIIKSYI